VPYYSILEGIIRIDHIEELLAQIRSLEKEFGVTIQFVNADLIAGHKHLEVAVEKAIKNFSKNPISSTLGMEILLYVSAQRQIQKALNFGLHTGLNRVGIVVIPPSKHIEDSIRNMLSEEQVLDFIPEKEEDIINAFNLTESEVSIAGKERIPDLVVERVILFSLSKK
jgi:KEOPS complex subunit Cgi121